LILKNELTEYNEDMLVKPSLVVLNKIDIEGAEENIERFKGK
jgi:GTP-binding protein